MHIDVDWARLSEELGRLRTNGQTSGRDLGRLALEQILGKDCIVNAVDHHVFQRPGDALAASVLSLFRPKQAMDRCYEIFRSSASSLTRQAAVNLLCSVGDERVLSWIKEFLDDTDPAIQSCGMWVLYHLAAGLFLQDKEVLDALRIARRHDNPEVRRIARTIARDRPRPVASAPSGQKAQRKGSR